MKAFYLNNFASLIHIRIDMDKWLLVRHRPEQIMSTKTVGYLCYTGSIVKAAKLSIDIQSLKDLILKLDKINANLNL